MLKKDIKYWSFLYNQWGTVVDDKFQNEISFEYPVLVDFEDGTHMVYTSEGLKFKWDKNKDLFNEMIVVPETHKLNSIKVKDKVWSFTMGRFGEVVDIDTENVLVRFYNTEMIIEDLEVNFKMKNYKRELFKQKILIPIETDIWSILKTHTP